MRKRTVTLDVREDIRGGREPFGRILQTAQGLSGSESLRLFAPFEPRPLYGLLGNLGFSHRASPLPNGDFEVLFFRGQEAAPEPGPSPERGVVPLAAATGSVIKVDARRLEPPQPLVSILEAVAKLPVGASLQAHTDRRPMHLYSQLEERGFVGETQEQPDGSFITNVRRK
jgi:uncharacterized protein (DUF2249 family)